MTKQKIIAFAAQMQNGKDTAADYLHKALNDRISDREGVRRGYIGDWRRRAFATAVKQVFQDAFGVDRDFLEEWKVKKEVPEGYLKPIRQSLQFIGDGFRQIKPNIWVEIALRDTTPMILSDARYINELKEVHERGGVNILLWRPGFENDDANASEAQILPLVKWASENLEEGAIQWDNPDMNIIPEGGQYLHLFIKNDGTEEDLYAKLDDIVVPFVEERWREQA
jgi:hypothetical protein